MLYTRAFPKLAHYGRAYASTHLDSRPRVGARGQALRGNDGMRWWGRGDSNSHAFRHMILSHARLPIPTLPHSIWGRLYPCELAGVERIGVRDRVFRLLDMVRMKRCEWDAGVELVCINLGELAAPGAKKFLKNAHFLHFLHSPKLSEGRPSFGRQCTF